ncbi:hypothetical protein [Polaribacter cellanae]|uniref:Uncharacterized protein n=1 Tax=Polaribacter cellanae TaxID=2818493 RepID=A0A975CSA4_9FLAO|nr:hypothetical protein [Polaribacter cellanae]QTE23994.1 hypothetical protein J3359_06920 [Polaribacter cellanae]
MKKQTENSKYISRKDAIKKISNYGKYAALTAFGTYIILNPQKAQAQSPEAPGTGF